MVAQINLEMTIQSGGMAIEERSDQNRKLTRFSPEGPFTGPRLPAETLMFGPSTPKSKTSSSQKTLPPFPLMPNTA
jgi:hypothetical protein